MWLQLCLDNNAATASKSLLKPFTSSHNYLVLQTND